MSSNTYRRWKETPLAKISEEVYEALARADLPVEEVGGIGQAVLVLWAHGDDGPTYKITITEEWN